MRIIVAGCGKLGMLLAENLTNEGHRVTVIDKDPDVLSHCEDILDVRGCHGSCVSVSVLEEADIKHADVLIGTTISDETNMLCCLIGKKMGAKYTIARIRDPEYIGSVNFITGEFAIDVIANPERATAREISRMLRLPFAANVETFARGLVEMVEIRVTGDEPFVGCPLNELGTKCKGMPRVLFCAVTRDKEAFIPTGDFVIKEGDSIAIAADPATTTSFFKFIGKDTRAAKNALIVGGSRIAYYLSTILTDSNIKTKLIENNEEKARKLDMELEKTEVVWGDGTDKNLLLSEGLESFSAFIALTDRDEENIMAGLYAKTVSNAKVIVKNNRLNYTELLEGLGMDGIISPTQIANNIIVRAVRARSNSTGSAVQRLYRIMGARAEAIEFIANKGAGYLNRPLSKLHITEGAIVAMIVHDHKATVPFGGDVIQENDHVVVITMKKGIIDLNDVLS